MKIKINATDTGALPTPESHPPKRSYPIKAGAEQRSSDTAPLTSEEQIEAYRRALFGVGTNSTDRLEKMISLLSDEWNLQPEVGWPIFHRVWSNSDDTWSHRDNITEFINLLRDVCPPFGDVSDPLDYLSGDDKEAFDELPKHIRIYRGCSVERIYGFSWTTDRKIAEQSARGHRGITVPDPVIAELSIPKRWAVGYYTDRNESEVLVDPDWLFTRAVTVRKYHPFL